MKKNVLVFPCGSEIGLELHKSLQYSTHFNLIGGSSVDDHGKFVFQNYIDDIPFVNDPALLDKLNEIIRTHNIDFVMPVHDNVILKLAEAKAAGNLACELVASPIETCQLATSKLKTYEFFKDHVATPRIYKNIDEVGPEDFPVFLKPEVGNGARGTQTAKNKEDAAFYMARDSSLLILEYLPGDEFTIDCFTNKDGQLLYCQPRRRARISNGISVNSVTVEDDRFQKLAETINSLTPFRGAWFYQVKERKDGELVLMEIAPRCAGTSGLQRGKGVNLPLLSLFDAMGYDVQVISNSGPVTIDRALQNSYKLDLHYSHAYIDFDDLVIFEDKVNPAVMAFIFQCINKNVSLHLITKHKENLHDTLAKYRLESIFDEIIWVQDDSEKHEKITERDAIFIDDSYSERKRVHDALGIPTFDAHSIECLMEKF